MLTIEHLHFSRDNTPILHDISFALAAGETGYLLGPSGGGKTTLLRLIAGFLHPSAGRIVINGHTAADHTTFLAAEQRRIGMVFQDAALFPHMTVFDNIAFGLRRLPMRVQRERVNQLLSMVAMSGAGQRFPHELSGGQQQRVALVRSIAPRPLLLLLDEPFSGLDVLLREQLIDALETLLANEATTTLAVTHDHAEAFAVADRVGVIHDGMLVQWDSSYRIFHEPSHPFVAGFIGDSALINATVLSEQTLHTGFGIIRGDTTSHAPGSHVRLLVRPNDVLFDTNGDYAATLVSKRFRGDQFLYRLALSDDAIVPCLCDGHNTHRIGDTIRFRTNFEHVVLFDAYR